MNKKSSTDTKGFIYNLKRAYNKKRIDYVIVGSMKRALNWLILTFKCNYYKISRSSKKFLFKGDYYSYFYHRYNTTWRNERAVEIPIICKILKEYQNKQVLEIGNVTSHYFRFDHDIVDKYEKAYGVINLDVVDLRPSKKYDLIISISTLEHVGWDENPENSTESLQDPTKILLAVKNLKDCLVSGGKLIGTVPIGQNRYLDKLIRNGNLQFDEQYYLKRISKDNKWVQTNAEDAYTKEYDYPFFAANALFLGIYTKTYYQDRF
ncbi:MAG: class I SAM-dependent methyltransferase [Euryarchaeota archaeon]|nr:class I SAM-dependent methyltransferase [Euryarchaeota archaeon]